MGISFNLIAASGSLTILGAYSAGTTYSVNDCVTESGSLYRSLSNGNIAHTPSTSPTFWEVDVTGGAVPANTDAAGTGATGASGTGATGSDGAGTSSSSGASATTSDGASATTSDGASATTAGASHNHAFTGTGLVMSGVTQAVNPIASELVSIVGEIDAADGAQILAAQPACPCRLNVRITDGNSSISAGTVTVLGVNARGMVVNQIIPLTGGTQTVVTNEAYALVTSATIAALAGAAPGDTISIGQSAALGLGGAQYGTGYAVFLSRVGATLNALASETVGAVDTSYGVITPTTAPDGSKDFEFWFTYTVTPAGTNAAESTHTHTAPAHTHTAPAHTHTAPAHTHTGAAHTHTGPSHTHTGPSHTHPITP